MRCQAGSDELFQQMRNCVSVQKAGLDIETQQMRLKPVGQSGLLS